MIQDGWCCLKRKEREPKMEQIPLNSKGFHLLDSFGCSCPWMFIKSRNWAFLHSPFPFWARIQLIVFHPTQNKHWCEPGFWWHQMTAPFIFSLERYHSPVASYLFCSPSIILLIHVACGPLLFSLLILWVALSPYRRRPFQIILIKQAL